MPVSNLLKFGRLSCRIALLTGLVLGAGCVSEDRPGDCPEDVIRQLLYLRVTDDLSRGDITDTEELDDIMVYLFDRGESLVQTIPYTQHMIRSGEPIDLTDAGIEGGYVTVWANLGNSVEIDPAPVGSEIDELEIRMLANDSRADFYLCPGDMLFGYKQIDLIAVNPSIAADTVWIKRKNSRLNLTVRGLTDTDNAADYYFRIGSLYSAYNFQGASQLEPRNIWEEGEFDTALDYVSPEPYIMIHNAPNHVYSETSRVLVEIYRVGETRSDTLIASGERDTEGQYIRLEQGKTTNVLIVLEPTTGDVELHMEITPWDEIIQWEVW